MQSRAASTCGAAPQRAEASSRSTASADVWIEDRSSERAKVAATDAFIDGLTVGCHVACGASNPAPK